MRNLFKRAGQLATAAVLAGLLLFTGCQPADGVSNEGVAQLAENLRMFGEDFARQALAAYLV